MTNSISTQCFFDVGGTKTDLRIVNVESRNSDIYTTVIRSEKVLTPSIEKNLIKMLSELIKPLKPDKIIVGIPGSVPTNIDENSEIYMPPLGYSLSVRSIQASLGKIILLNDMQVLSGITSVCDTSIYHLIDFRDDKYKKSNIDRKALITFGTSVGLILSIYCEVINQYIDVPLEVAHRKQLSRRGDNTVESVMEIFDGKVELMDIQAELTWVDEAAFLMENIVKEYKIDALYIAGGRRNIILKHISRLEKKMHELIRERGQMKHNPAVYVCKNEPDLFSYSVRNLAIRYL